MATRNAQQIGSLIKQMIKMDLAELGSDETTQNTFIYDFMSMAMQEWAKLAYQTKVSDALSIMAGGNVTFQASSADITDLYEPLWMLDSSGQEVTQRTSYSAPKGWWKTSANAQFHMKGLNGSYTLHYIKYPEWIALGTQTPEWPEAGYQALIYKTMGMIVESKGFIDEANNYYNLAERHLKPIVAANMASRGTGRPPSFQDIDNLRG